jgi:bifunctional NMN adenylyltransferase/nudix hydrolase
MYDLIAIIGRASPFTKAHEHLVKCAKEKGNKVIWVYGSTDQARDLRNPLTFKERKAQFKAVFPEDSVTTVGVRDCPYDDHKWVARVQSAVYNSIDNGPNLKTAILGHGKDETTFYLDMFPFWDKIEVESFGDVNATDVRNFAYTHYLNDRSNEVRDLMPEAAYQVFARQTQQPFWSVLRDEYEENRIYKEQTHRGKYPPIFQTADSVVTCSGCVLMVERADNPGKGLFALPGGFINEYETLRNAALRELDEETCLKVPKKVLDGSIKSIKTFDYPQRSIRGRTITTAYHIDLGFQKKLPKVKGGDDAKNAFWMPLADIDPTKMFEDHFHIIDWFTSIS